MSRKVARCPKCRGTRLSVIEVTEVVGVADFGEVEIDPDDGGLIPPSDFYFEPGLINRVEIECPCGHHWRSRKSVSLAMSSPRR